MRRRRWRASAAGLLLSLAALLSVLVSALVDIPGDADNTNKSEEWSGGRVRGISREPVISRLLARTPGGAAAFAALSEVFEDAIADENCALRDTQWVQQLTGYSGLRGWPLPDRGCVSSSRVRHGKMRFSASDFRERLAEYGRVIDVVKDDVVKAGVGNFSEPTVPGGWRYEEGKYKQCSILRATGVRYRAKGSARNQWYFVAGVSNDRTEKDFADWDRQYMNEYVGVDAAGEIMSPLPMNLRVWPGPGGGVNQSLPREKFATSFEMWGGRVGLSAVYNMVPSDAPALVAALDLSKLDENQATDALTPSNVAILALPMVLNVIPIALVADVSSFGLLAYTVATDMLTTVPFIIKGWELMAIGGKTYVAEEVWHAGRRRDVFIVSEGWNAECRLVGVRSIGVTFLSVGFGFLVAGVLAELWARRLRARWTADGTLGVPKHSHLKAALLQRDLRVAVGLHPEKPTNPEVLEEEQQFLENQTTMRPPPVVHRQGY